MKSDKREAQWCAEAKMKGEKEMTRYLPTIIAEGREFTNVTYTSVEKAREALKEFLETFKELTDYRIEYAYIRKC